MHEIPQGAGDGREPERPLIGHRKGLYEQPEYSLRFAPHAAGLIPGANSKKES
jgi:hypothetical protein